MTDLIAALTIGSVPSLVALLIGALALRRNTETSDTTARLASDALTASKMESMGLEIQRLNKQVESLTTLLDEANMKLLRELLKRNGGATPSE